MNRRELLGMGGVGVAAVAAAGLLWSRNTTSAPDAVSTFRVRHSDAEWRRLLTHPSYAILREGATEPPYSSPLLNEHRPGLFACAGCSNPLFQAATKYESHTGWPSFSNVIPGATVQRSDYSLGMSRTEVVCATCGGHLGHVFKDGPKPTGLRYCMNGLALSFRPANA